MRIVIGVLAVALGWTSYAVYFMHPAAGQEVTTLERKITGQTLTSAATPRVKLTFDPAFTYVGGQRFLLYGVANAEQHFFVEADAQKRVKRLYWVQFEGYLPSNTHTYDYSDQPLKFQYGGMEWLTDIRASSLPATEENPNSDGGRYRAMLRAKGYVLPQEGMRVRMVNLDAAKRSELMIIYLEDLSPLGLTAADVKEGGRGQARWAGIQQDLLARAKAGMKVE